MSVNRREVEQGLPELLKRLWRYGLVLSGDRHVAEELVQATCLRALEKCEQFHAGTSLSRWTFTILSSIWKNELRSRSVRLGEGVVDAELALVSDGDEQIEMNIFASQVLKEIEAFARGAARERLSCLWRRADLSRSSTNARCARRHHYEPFGGGAGGTWRPKTRWRTPVTS